MGRAEYGVHRPSFEPDPSLPLFDDSHWVPHRETESHVQGGGDSTPTNPGRFRKRQPHASGGLGKVSIAEDQELRRDVALKEIQHVYADDPECRRRFLLEAHVTGSLEHPGVVPVYGMGFNDQGRPYYAMRFIRGESLRDAIERLYPTEGDEALDEEQRTREVRRLLQRFVTVCNTIEYAHSRGVLHRDIKPDNIMLGPYGETLVVDWGLAKFVKAGEESDPTRVNAPEDLETESTRLGTAMGTPGYMSPEQALGWHDSLTPASEVYSLGATLYCLATGEHAIARSTLEQMIRATQTGDFRAPSEANPSIAKPLEAVILKAMATKSKERYETVGDLADDLDGFLAGEPVTAWREPWSVRVQRWIHRHRTAVSTGVSAVGIATVALAIGVVVLSNANRRIASAREAAEDARDNATEISELALSQYGDYVKSITNSRRLRTESLEPLRRDLLVAARDFYTKLASISGGSTDLSLQEADAYFRLGNINNELEDRETAMADYQNAIRILERLADDGPGDDKQVKLLIAKNKMNLALNQRILGNHSEASDTLQDAQDITADLQSRPVATASQEQLAAIFHNRGSWQFADGDLDAAESSFLEAERLINGVLQESPGNIESLLLSARTESNLGLVYSAFNRFDDSIKRFRHGIQLLTELQEAHPDPYNEAEIARSLAQHRGRGTRAVRF